MADIGVEDVAQRLSLAADDFPGRSLPPEADPPRRRSSLRLPRKRGTPTGGRAAGVPASAGSSSPLQRAFQCPPFRGANQSDLCNKNISALTRCLAARQRFWRQCCGLTQLLRPRLDSADPVSREHGPSTQPAGKRRRAAALKKVGAADHDRWRRRRTNRMAYCAGQAKGASSGAGPSLSVPVLGRVRESSRVGFPGAVPQTEAGRGRQRPRPPFAVGPSLRSGVSLAVAQPVQWAGGRCFHLSYDVRIDHRRLQACVAEEFLDLAQVRAADEQMGGKRVT